MGHELELKRPCALINLETSASEATTVFNSSLRNVRHFYWALPFMTNPHSLIVLQSLLAMQKSLPQTTVLQSALGFLIQGWSRLEAREEDFESGGGEIEEAFEACSCVETRRSVSLSSPGEAGEGELYWSPQERRSSALVLPLPRES